MRKSSWDARRSDPTNLELVSVLADLFLTDQDWGRASDLLAELRAMGQANPRAAQLGTALEAAILSGQNRTDESLAVLQDQLADLDEDGRAALTIAMAQIRAAGALEQSGDIDGAIAIYEGLYTADSANVVVANNLASLLTAHRTDDASLDRAYRIARRLRGIDVPAFQDTYGWIAHRRGDYAEALDYLRPAALGLPGDPLVQYHLGKTQHALGKTDAAIDTLTQALEIAGDNPLPQFDDARALLTELIQSKP